MANMLLLEKPDLRIASIALALVLVTACNPTLDPDAGSDAASGVDGATAHDAATMHDAATAHDAANSDRGPTADATHADGATASDHAASADGASDAGPAVLHLLTPLQLHDMLTNKDFLLIDVRGGTPAAQIPQTDATILFTDVDGLVAYIGSDLDTRVVVYCASGGRSGTAGASLVSRGYRAIFSLSGGINAWIAVPYPTVTPGADAG